MGTGTQGTTPLTGNNFLTILTPQEQRAAGAAKAGANAAEQAAVRTRVLENIADSQSARASSGFDVHVARTELGVNAAGAAGETAASIPKGYIANADGTITGPRGGTYSATSAVNANGNPIFVANNGNYYTLSADGATRIVSPNPPSSIGATGKIGEDALKLLGGQSQVTLQTNQGARVIDQLAPGNIANESKVGYTALDPSTALQVSKDAELLNNGRVNGVTWNFYTSPVTGQGGPSQTLLQALTNAGINVVIH